ncbi:WD40/YVTN/BNR-like repeat-containing protein [Hymenobacter sp. HDW8]|uniref:WD40/YVTN/BNR-like repeat-containing protein n=1 Tax=Hymenobacter sp. HDW8 TaxID=2714932 RepID=UPI00140D2FDC|nr:hypothetical protein [Hymenobacter sp. HDW8]QIL75067.1 hypothetical protein G7064_03755 [Hymenobacter sp. HDW8]
MIHNTSKIFSQYFKITVCIIAIGLACISCNKNDKSQVDINVKNKISNKKFDRPKFDPAVFDLLAISSDTLIAVKWHGGFSITTDAGKNWQTLHQTPKSKGYVYFKYMMFDNNRILWGLDSWKGIHEADYSRISYSSDFGKTWKTKEFQTEDFFPYKFYSKSNKKLQIITFNGKVYEANDKLASKWNYVKYVPTLDNSENPADYNTFYYDNLQFKLEEVNTFLGRLYQKQKSEWKLVIESDFITEAQDVCLCNKNIYLTGTNGYYVDSLYYLFKIQKNRIVEKIKIPKMGTIKQGRYLLCDSKNRLWLYNFQGIWLKEGRNLSIKY